MIEDLPKNWFRQPPDLNQVQDADGWATYVARRDDYQMPPLLTRSAYEGLASRQRALYNLARKVAVSNLPKPDTPMAAAIREQIETTLSTNTLNADPGVRPGLFISAEGGLGKSTLMREVAASFDEETRQMADIFPGMFGNLDRWIPVIWINVPPKVSIGALCRKILNFYGEVPRGIRTEAQLTDRVHTLIRDCGTRLVVLDDITRVKMHREADQDAADWIRGLQETSATVIGIGVDVEGCGLLYEGRAGTKQKRLLTQTRRRFSVLNLDPFTYDSAEEITEWVAHLAAVEQDLPLLDKTPGMLSEDLPEFLFAQTGGVIGSLSRYIAEASNAVLGRSVADGGEHLTRDDFLKVQLDHAAVSGSSPEIDAATSIGKKAASSRKKQRNGSFNGDRQRRVPA
ncbi:AAA family ATPase [Blastococcus saxobsidens]|uniref:AAA family ATPase n=1 Tax=Blastococcus saxobsidens TaxID=138336 RepID=A0A6L9W4I1_9ACTN|nr:ATP-binding protein [Blastococcus saxobsidens]NEK86953.1 AAA family ATPase [Blastococcus saxobsidens]